MNIVNPLDGFRISRRVSPLKRAWPLLMVSPIGSSLKTQNVQHDRRVVRSIPARTLSSDGGAACGSSLSAAPRTGTFARAG